MALPQLPADGRRLDELRARADDRDNLHWPCSSICPVARGFGPGPAAGPAAVAWQRLVGAALLGRRRPEQLGGDPLLALEGEAGEHRQRQNLGGGLFGDGEITCAEAQALVRLAQMQRHRVVDAGPDTCSSQVRLHAVPIRDPDDVEMVDRARPVRHVRKDRGALAGQELPIRLRACAALLVPRRETTKLHAQNMSLNAHRAVRCIPRSRGNTSSTGRGRAASGSVARSARQLVVTAPASPQAPRFLPG